MQTMKNIAGDIRSHLLIAALVLVGLFLAVRFLVTHKAGGSGGTASGSNTQAFLPSAPDQVISVQFTPAAQSGGDSGTVGSGITPPVVKKQPRLPVRRINLPGPLPPAKKATPPVVRKQPAPTIFTPHPAASVGKAVAAKPAPRAIHVPTGVIRAHQVEQSRATPPAPAVKRAPLPGVFRRYNTEPTPANTPTGVRRFLNIA